MQRTNQNVLCYSYIHVVAACLFIAFFSFLFPGCEMRLTYSQFHIDLCKYVK